jgi:hypothetical protein
MERKKIQKIILLTTESGERIKWYPLPVRDCTCGSGEPWNKCYAASSYCG